MRRGGQGCSLRSSAFSAVQLFGGRNHLVIWPGSREGAIVAPMSELAKIYRDMAARYRADAESLRLWPDQALALMRQAQECETKAQQHERQAAAPDGAG